MNNCIVGLGDHDYDLAVYIGNRPAMQEYKTLSTLHALQAGDIDRIVQNTGNHWRKIFNIFAKLMFQLDIHKEPTWQDYRDHILLQRGSGHALIFSPYYNRPSSGDTISIISGKSYAQTLGVFESAIAMGDDFYIDAARKVIITPYFDYRQLSNRKLDMLTSIIKGGLKPQ